MKSHEPCDGGIINAMQSLADDGWCVVLKRLPKELGWLFPGARSEYDAPCDHQLVGHGMWYASAEDVRPEGYRVSCMALKDTAAAAMAEVAEQAAERNRWQESRKKRAKANERN